MADILMHRELRYELNPTARRDLDSGADGGGIVSDENDRIPVDECPRGAGVERQADNDVSVWAPETRRNDDQSALRVERDSHNTTAVSSGSVPVRVNFLEGQGVHAGGLAQPSKSAKGSRVLG